MKFKIHFQLFLLSFFFIIFQSCNSTKFVPDGEYLLASAKVKTDVKAVSTKELNNYIKQKPNFKTFSLFNLPLSIYNLSGEDTTKWINRTLRDAGEPPVIFDSALIDRSVTDLGRVMMNKGYLGATIGSDLTLEGKKARVAYSIRAGTPHRIANYSINIADSVIDKMIIPLDNRIRRQGKDSRLPKNFPMSTDSVLRKNTLVNSSDIFDLNLLDAERQRITSIFRRTGYYRFNKEHVGFVADTTLGNNMVGLELAIYPSTTKGVGGEIIESAHQRYVVKEVHIYVDFNPLVDGDISGYQTSSVHQVGNFFIHYGPKGRYIRPEVILDCCHIHPGRLYNENLTTLTYSALSQLNILKNTNISYTELVENDSTMLRCTITCVSDKRQGTSAEIEATNSGGFFGMEGSVGYLHRNIFKGSELFNVKLRGAYEAITPSFTSFSDNYFEISGETSLTFPRFMFPFLKKDFKQRIHASTQFGTNYTFQRRPGYFTRTVLSSGVKYVWQGRQSSSARHVFDLVDVSYVHIPKLDSTFDATLTMNARKYSFTDQFVLGTGYTYSKNNLTNSTKKYGYPISSIRASVETAGNSLALIAKLANLKKDLGSREIFGTKFVQYVRGTVDYSQTIHVDERNSVAWHIGSGVAYAYGNFKEIPIQKRFYSGGANSVRGWGVRELGPGSFSPPNKTYDNFFYHSGDIRLDANVEYRTKLFWVLELAAFLDAGNIWTVKEYEGQERGSFKFDRFYKEIALAWGVGFRFDFDFVLIRLDCGWKAYDPSYNLSASEKWKIKDPFNMGKNTAWHIAVGYPF